MRQGPLGLPEHLRKIQEAESGHRSGQGIAEELATESKGGAERHGQQSELQQRQGQHAFAGDRLQRQKEPSVERRLRSVASLQALAHHQLFGLVEPEVVGGKHAKDDLQGEVAANREQEDQRDRDNAR